MRAADLPPAPGVTLMFDDLFAGPVPDNAAITSGGYRPGGSYGPSAALRAPAPAPPYATSLSALNGETVRGVWRLWVFDDVVAADSGVFVDGSLIVFTQASVNPFTYTMRPASSSRQPFVRVNGDVTQLDRMVSASWRVTDDRGHFFASGPVTIGPGIDRFSPVFSAVIPVRRGINHIQVRAQSVYGVAWSGFSIANITEFWYTLPEGATGDFFDLDVSLANPTNTAAPIAVEFLSEGASPVPYTNRAE